MLTVGENSYITLEEAEDCLDGAVGGEAWIDLEPVQKRRYLLAAAQNVDSLLFTGRKSDCNQPMAFPRAPLETVPNAVKLAQALEALALSDAQAASRRKLQEQGVASISLGKASESYREPVGGQLASTQAKALLRPWIAGSVTIA